MSGYAANNTHEGDKVAIEFATQWFTLRNSVEDMKLKQDNKILKGLHDLYANKRTLVASLALLLMVGCANPKLTYIVKSTPALYVESSDGQMAVLPHTDYRQLVGPQPYPTVKTNITITWTYDERPSLVWSTTDWKQWNPRNYVMTNYVAIGITNDHEYFVVQQY